MTVQEQVRGQSKIPCLYIGEHPIRLSPQGGPYYNAQGRPLTNLDLEPGDGLMMPEVEVRGMTFWHDPSGVRESEFLGVGRVVKADHRDLEQEVLMALGYEFHDGRSDFLPLGDVNKASEASAAPAQSNQSTQSAKSGKAAASSEQSAAEVKQ